MEKKIFLVTVFVFIIQYSLFINHCESQWFPVNSGIERYTQNYLFNINNKLYAVNGGGLYYSTNNGIKWQKNSLTATLSVLFKKDSCLLAGGYNGMYLTTNDGLNWLQTMNNMYHIRCITNYGNQLFAGAGYNGIYKSSNNGFNWVQIYPYSPNAVTSIVIKDNLFFAGILTGEYSMGRVMVSTNYGTNWSSTTMDSTSITTLNVKGQNIFAGTEMNGLYKSTDNGNNWSNIGFEGFEISSFNIIDSVIYIFCNNLSYQTGGFYKSTDDGLTWQNINIGFNNTVCSIAKINNLLVIGMEYRGIFISSDNGVNWIHYLSPDSEIITLYKYNSRLFAGVNNEGIYYSDDEGANWIQTKFNHKNPESFNSNGSNIFSGVFDIMPDTGGVFISADNGINWNYAGLRGKTIYALSYFNSKLFAGAAYSGIYTSTDNGVNWVHLSSLSGSVPYCFFQRGSKIFTGMFRDNHYFYTGLYFTMNGGTSWDSIQNINSIGKIDANSNCLFSASNNLPGVYKSSDEGITWIPTSINLGVWDLIVNGNYVFAGTTMNGVYMSSDNGNSWVQKNQGLDITNIHSLLISNGYIFAGTYGKGIYKRALSDIMSINQISVSVPEKYILYQNFPNPFNPTTKIRFDIPRWRSESHRGGGIKGVDNNEQYVTLKVYDILGKEIATLVNEKLQPGTYEVTFDGTNNPSGIYFYKLTTDDLSDVKRMILIK